jgi:hypothetical protein
MSAENGRACGEDAAAYVLGALEPAEVEAFRRHMVDCGACREWRTPCLLAPATRLRRICAGA